MAEFLTDAWIAALGRAAGGAEVPRGLRLAIQQVVLGDDGRETAYLLRIADGRVTVTRGRADDADITLTQDRTTAAHIARGELSAQAAFIAGRLRVTGDLRSVMERSSVLTTLGDLFRSVRAATTGW